MTNELRLLLLIKDKLEQYRLGKIKRLIIHIPPRHLVSLCASVDIKAISLIPVMEHTLEEKAKEQESKPEVSPEADLLAQHAKITKSEKGDESDDK
jgi:hypothetical protein